MTYGIIIIPIISGIELTKIAIQSNILPFIIITALIGTLSYIFYYRAIDSIGPVKATGLNVTYSIWAIIFEILFVGNEITLKLLICAILIIIGSTMVSKD